MRETIIGLVLAVCLIGGLFAADRYAPNEHPVPPSVAAAQKIETAAAEVHPGFVGSKGIGLWQLDCTAKPTVVSVPATAPAKTSTDASGKAAAPATSVKIQLGRCRTTLFYRRRDNPKVVMMAITFRFIGDKKLFGVFVVLPSIVKQGDVVALHIPQGFLKLPVASCQDKGPCIARGALQDSAAREFLKAKKAQLIIPRPNSKQAALPLPLVGLSEAIDAMRRAES